MMDERERIDYTVEAVWRLIKRLIKLSVLWTTVLYILLRYGPYVLVHLRSIAVGVLAAIVLTYALLPGVNWLCRRRPVRCGRRTQRLLATIAVFVVFLGLVALSVLLFIHPLKEEITQFSGKVGDYSAEISKFFARASKWYAEAVPKDVRTVIKGLDYSKAAAWATEYGRKLLLITTSSVGIILEVLLVPVLAFYFLLDHKSITREIYGLVPKHKRRDALIIGHSVGQIMQSYIFGQLILCAIAGILTGLFLTLMGVPYVVVLALFAAITRAIPIIGPVVSGIPIVLVGILAPGGSTALAIYLLIFVIVMHFAESKFIMPHLIGERLHLNPAIVIIVLLIGAEFMGLIGMFLAAPVAAVIRELVRLYYIRPRHARKKAGA